ncbi:MAG TPA: dihydrofolate reductase family protein [Solirubrobacterales bacterium]|nr:dihydrofolate reductase family protein [Solirubrobacterales bacterium]
MATLVYSMGVSLDGFVAGPGGDISWSAPDEELHRFHNRLVEAVDLQLCGRRLYETMLVWETWEEEQPEASAVELEFAPLWRATPKLVFSRTLERVEGNAQLATGEAAEVVRRLKGEIEGEIDVGGAGLAADLIRAGLVDEYRLFVSPVILGAGVPFFPAVTERIDLDLLETRDFGSRVAYLRCRAKDGG